ncbi:MAG TPA: hypothetical protein VG826_02445 [Pirellulales bacterium]|nr:hypothetical protein [Pirellulales bacterium]
MSSDPPVAAEILCPLCSEPIQAAAKKCKHCGEFLDRALRATSAGSHAATGQGPSPAGKSLDIGRVAMARMGVMLALLTSAALYFFAMVAIVLQVHSPALGLLLFFAASMASLAGTVLVFLLATQVYEGGVGILMGILSLTPCLGLVILLVVNVQAISVLRRHGYKVGLLGGRSETKDPSLASRECLGRTLRTQPAGRVKAPPDSAPNTDFRCPFCWRRWPGRVLPSSLSPWPTPAAWGRWGRY